MVQDDTAIDKYRSSVVGRHFRAWRGVVKAQVYEKNKERTALENQNALRDMMLEIEDNTAELLALEQKKFEEKQRAEAKAKADAQAYRLKQAKQRAQAERQHEQALILSVQRDVRRRVVAKQMKAMKRSFNKEWKEKEEEMVNASIRSASEYFEDKANKVEIQVRLERLKREFFASPLENKEREKVITSVQNIVFLHLEAKMNERGMRLKQIIPQFDLEGKGYLSYAEFRTIVNSLDCKVSETQITEVLSLPSHSSLFHRISFPPCYVSVFCASGDQGSGCGRRRVHQSPGA
jgi:Ca2+-binding EF-hand superfamily protein